MMKINGAYNGSEAQRIMAMNSNVRANRERCEELDKVFVDSKEKGGAISLWCFTLTMTLPLLWGILLMRSHPALGLMPDDWRQMIVLGLILSFSTRTIAGAIWKTEFAGNNAVNSVKALLVTHNEIIDIVYRLEKVSETIDSLGTRTVTADVIIEANENAVLNKLIEYYDTYAMVSTARLYRYRGCPAGVRQRADLLDDSLSSSKTYLAQLLRSRPWLSKYIPLLRN